MTHHQQEVTAGDRFASGANWSRFLSRLDGSRIKEADLSLKKMLRVETRIETLSRKPFLDIGSGSMFPAMTYWYDIFDWLGVYPFEVATSDEITDFYKTRGLTAERTVTCGSRNSCNDFVLSWALGAK